MKNLSIVVYALAGAGVVALSIAHLAHTVLGVPSAAIRNDALGTAACLTAFIGAGLLARKRSKWPPKPLTTGVISQTDPQKRGAEQAPLLFLFLAPFGTGLFPSLVV